MAHGHGIFARASASSKVFSLGAFSPLSKPEVAMGDEDASTGSSWNLTVLFRTMDKACFLDLFARLGIDSKAVTRGLAATLRPERTPMVSPLDRGVRQHSGWAEKLSHCQGPCPCLGCKPRFTLRVGACSAASECARGQPMQVWLVRFGDFGEFAYRSYSRRCWLLPQFFARRPVSTRVN